MFQRICLISNSRRTKNSHEQTIPSCKLQVLPACSRRRLGSLMWMCITPPTLRSCFNSNNTRTFRQVVSGHPKSPLRSCLMGHLLVSVLVGIIQSSSGTPRKTAQQKGLAWFLGFTSSTGSWFHGIRRTPHPAPPHLHTIRAIIAVRQQDVRRLDVAQRTGISGETDTRNIGERRPEKRLHMTLPKSKV